MIINKTMFLLLSLSILLFFSLPACSKPPEALMSASSMGGQAPLSVTFTNESTNADRFRWDFGDGITTTTTDINEPVTHEYTKAGTHTVTLTAFKEAEPQLTSVMTLDINVTYGNLDRVELSPNAIELGVTESQQLLAEAVDTYGNPISEAIFTWEAIEKTVNITNNGLITAGTKSGVFDPAITVTALLNNQSANTTVGVTVKHGPLDRVNISPNTVSLKVGDIQQFVAEAVDAYDNPIPEAQVTWKISAGAGSITEDGLFTAGRNAGEGVTVIATYNGKSVERIASVILKPGPMVRLSLSPETADLYYNQSQQITAKVFDNNDIPVTNVTLSWEVVEGTGTISGNGLYTAGSGISFSTATIKVTAEAEGVSLSATSILTIRQGFKYMTYLGMNVKAPYIFNNPDLRKAISLCIDRDELTSWIRETYNNDAEKVKSIVSPSVSNTNLNPDKDIEKAGELMWENGYPNGYKVMMYTHGEYANIASILSAYLADLGIEAEIRVLADQVSLVSISPNAPFLFLTKVSVDFTNTNELLGRLLLSTSEENLSGYTNTGFNQAYNSGSFNDAENIAFEDNSGPIVPLYWSN